jgi:hypothetical protein
MELLPTAALLVMMLSSAVGARAEADATARGVSSEAPGQLAVHEAYGRLPLSFEPNQGQADREVKFLSRGRGYTLFLTAGEAVLALQRPGERREASIVRVSLAGANRDIGVEGLDELPGKVSYFMGRDPGNWRRNIQTYARVHYADVYPGVDLIYYSTGGQLQYDFVVAPGADPQAIRLMVDGARVAVDATGDLVGRVAEGEIRMRKPVIYQEVDGVRAAIAGQWMLAGPNQAAFKVDAYDRGKPLVIDPVLSYSTYLGGSFDDYPREIAVDALGHAHVTGPTNSVDFPTTAGAVQPSLVGSHGHYDVFVAKLEPDGSAVVYSTYLGGFAPDEGWGIAVDGAGNAYVTGLTSSPDFPVTPGAFQTAFGSGLSRVFVAKLDPTGSVLAYSTFIGGSLRDEGRAIAVDNAGRAYVTGNTDSSDFPITPGAFQSVQQGPGPGDSDAFVTKLEADGSSLVYSTFLGAGGSEVGRGIAVDGQGHAYVIGESVAGFPTTPGAFQPIPGGANDAFVTKLNLDGTALVYSTFLGGSRAEFGTAIALDTLGNAYVAGQTLSADFPTPAGGSRRPSAGAPPTRSPRSSMRPDRRSSTPRTSEGAASICRSALPSIRLATPISAGGPIPTTFRPSTPFSRTVAAGWIRSCRSSMPPARAFSTPRPCIGEACGIGHRSGRITGIPSTSTGPSSVLSSRRGEKRPP